MLVPMHRPSQQHPEWRALAVALACLSGCNEDALRMPPPRASSSASSSASSAAEGAPPAASGSSSPGSASSVAALSNAAWSAVARSPDAFELHAIRGALFLDAAGFLANLGDGPLRQSPALMRGLEKGVSGRVLGAYPSAAWIVSGAATYHWAADRWAPEALLREHETLLDLVAWDDGRAIAAIALPDNDMRLALAGGRAGVPPAVLPVLSAPGVEARDARDPRAVRGARVADADETETPCKVRMKPRGVHLAGLPTGELFAAGYACEPLGHGPAIVERWARNEARGVVDLLPQTEGSQGPQIAGVLARSASDVVVYGSEGVPPAPYVARFDGAAWALEPVPFGAAVDTLAAADDGTLWAAAAGTVWRRPAHGAWEAVPLPAGLVALAAWPATSRTSTDVWVSARQAREHNGRTRAVLLRTAHGEVADPLRLPPRNAMAGMIATNGRFFATAACDKVWVQLRTLGPSKDASGKPVTVPKDFAALKPLLQGDLAGLAPVVEDDGGVLTLGVLAPTRELGRKLLAAYTEANPHETPLIFCHEPLALPKTK
jgi:hypothetical protein